jgi:CheY-like chemotaxis protein
VEVESAGIDAGSSFVVSLPDVKPVAEVAPRPKYVKPPQLKRATLLPASLSVPIRLDGIAVMIIDDDADARVVNERLLRLVGAEVMTAASGAEALAGLALAETHGRAPDVLVCDIRMPDFDGYEFMHEVRRRGFDARQLPAIAVTGLQSVEMARKSALAGFQYHLIKPLDIGRLTAVIASLTCPLHVKHLATSH